MDNKRAIKRLTKAIKELGTQAAFAEKHGISQVYVSDLLNGRRNFSKRMLDALGMHIDYVEND